MTADPTSAPVLSGSKLLITGATGQVALPLTLALAKDNDVWGVARFKDEAARHRLEAAGVTCVARNLSTDDFDGLPDDFDYVLNLAVVKSGKWDRDLAANGESVGLLMHHCRKAKAVLHCSSTGVYAPNGHEPLAEDAPLGDNHRVLMPTYSIAKIAAEVMARYGARQWGIPTTIARLNVPYGDHGGWPAFHLEMLLAGQTIEVHTNAPSQYNPIHDDDILEHIPGLLAAASVPATIVNWAGPDVVSIEEWCTYMGDLVDVEPAFVYSDHVLESVVSDNTRMNELIGPARVTWQDGLRRMVAARHPERLAAAAPSPT
jgi:nucleoside-diphosphate-sugar epimerase